MPDLQSLTSTDYSSANAVDILKAALQPYGLDALGPDMYDTWKNNGNDSNLTYLWLRGTHQYQDRFAGMALREKNGYSPMTEKQYIDWESGMKSAMKNNGIPSGFYDTPGEMAQLIGNDISVPEVNSRITQGVQAAANAPQYVKDALFNFYGVDDGHLAAYYLDPTKSQALLQQQATTAQIGGAATYSGYGDLSKSEAEQLQKQGVTGSQALSQFGQLDYGKQLLSALPGEAGGDVSREQQMAFVANDPVAQQAMQQAAARRKAAFGGGGGVTTTAQGAVGAGQAS